MEYQETPLTGYTGQLPYAKWGRFSSLHTKRDLVIDTNSDILNLAFYYNWAKWIGFSIMCLNKNLEL